MKVKNINLILCFVVLLCSCNDWLDLEPRTQKETSKLFSKQQGFEDALAGTYMELLHDRAYGEDLMMGKIEFLANLWTPAGKLEDLDGLLSGEEALCLHKYDHKTAISYFSQIYEQLYKVVLGSNAILQYIDRDTTIFEEGAYAMLKGEALAIRAFCHFDVLRLWGPVPGTEEEGKPILNYVKTVSLVPHAISTYDEFKNQLLEDLTIADSLLAIGYDKYRKGVFNDNNFFEHYPFRFSTFGVRALLARVWLWFGEDRLAYEYATGIIEDAKAGAIPAVKDASGSKLRLGGKDDFVKVKQYSLLVEHLLSLYQFDLETKYDALFGGESGESVPKVYKSSNSDLVARDVFDNRTTDYRYNLWDMLYSKDGESYFTLRKKYECSEDKIGAADRRYIPLIRLSEMYFIALETGDDLSEKYKLWIEFRVKRNVPAVAFPADKRGLQKVLMTEYRREFYGEGQVFYLYKRLNIGIEDFLWATPGMEINYVLPAPESENFYKTASN